MLARACGQILQNQRGSNLRYSDSRRFGNRTTGGRRVALRTQARRLPGASDQESEAWAGNAIRPHFPASSGVCHTHLVHDVPGS